jgi:UDP:flavonoid glycosyltransferase YjiC (YdhE family)
MARILVTAMPFAGHVTPLAAVAGELVRRGHHVVAYGGAKYRDRFVEVGTDWLPWSRAPDYDDAHLADAFPALADVTGFRRGIAVGRHVLVGTGTGQAEDILAAARRRPFDLFVADQLAFGAPLAAEATGTRFATVAVMPLAQLSSDLPPSGFLLFPATGPVGRARDAALRGVTRLAFRLFTTPAINGLRASVGLGPTKMDGLDSFYSPSLFIAQGVPGLEYPRSDLPPQVHFVGRLAVPPTADLELPAWWPDLLAARAVGRPVVHVTQGTLETDPDDLIKPAIAALADEDVLVVCATGAGAGSVLGVLPDNVRAAPLLPYDRLLPLVDVMVTNGGWGGILAAAEAGVPLVVAGGSLDKPENARRVAWSGMGLDLRSGRPKPKRVGRAVRQVLGSPRLRLRAAELGEAVTAAGGACAAAALVETLLPRGA